MQKITGTLLVLILLLVLSSCSKPQVTEKKPYGVHVTEFRNYYHAAEAAKRLRKEFNVGSRVVLVEDKDEQWYYVIAGAEKDLEKVREFQRSFEESAGFKKTEIFSYDNPDRVEFNEDSLRKSGEQFIERNYPAVSENIREAVAMTPVLENYTIHRMSVMEFSDKKEDRKRYSGMYDITTDLPRGISRTKLSEVAVTLSESVLNDNLFGDRVTLNMVKLKLNHGIEGSDVAGYFADLIVDTDKYRFEEKKPLKIKSFTKLSGYEVVIEPKKDYFRTYYVLFDKSEQWGIFVQSTDKTREEMIEIVKDFGKGNGMMDYSSFKNTFMTLPDSNMLDATDLFVGFSLSKIGWDYTKSRGYSAWSKGYVGHWSAKGYYHNENKGSWTLGIYDLLTEEKNSRVNELYTKHVGSSTKRVPVQGEEGFYVTRTLWSDKNYEYYDKAHEVNASIGRYVCMVDNTENSWLSKDELADRMNWMQVTSAGGYVAPGTEIKTGTIRGFLKEVDDKKQYTEVCVIDGDDGKEYRFDVRTRKKNSVRKVIGLKEYYGKRPKNDVEYAGKNLDQQVKFSWIDEEVENKKTKEISIQTKLLKVVRAN